MLPLTAALDNYVSVLIIPCTVNIARPAVRQAFFHRYVTAKVCTLFVEV